MSQKARVSARLKLNEVQLAGMHDRMRRLAYQLAHSLKSAEEKRAIRRQQKALRSEILDQEKVVAADEALLLFLQQTAKQPDEQPLRISSGNPLPALRAAVS